MPRKIMSEDELEDYDPAQPTQAQASPIVQPTVELLPVKKQKINSVEQKEEAMHYLGLTRKKYMRVIIDALEAYKWADVIDRQGNVKSEWVPDIDKQRWGAEQAAKLFGDY